MSHTYKSQLANVESKRDILSYLEIFFREPSRTQMNEVQLSELMPQILDVSDDDPEGFLLKRQLTLVETWTLILKR